MLIRPDVDFGALFYQLFFKLYHVYKLFSINSLIQVSWTHLATFHGFLTGFRWYVRNKHFSWTWGVNRMLKILKYFRALNVSKPLWFHDLNITIKIKTAVMINPAPMMKMQMIFLMRMKKFQKSFFILMWQTWCKSEKLLLLKANDPFHYFYLLYITKKQGSITS